MYIHMYIYLYVYIYIHIYIYIHPFTLCFGRGSEALTLSCSQVCRSPGPHICPRSSLFARLVPGLSLLVSTVVSPALLSCCVIWRPNLPLSRGFPHCGCLHFNSFSDKGPFAHQTLVGECTGLTRTRDLRRMSESN